MGATGIGLPGFRGLAPELKLENLKFSSYRA